MADKDGVLFPTMHATSASRPPGSGWPGPPYSGVPPTATRPNFSNHLILWKSWRKGPSRLPPPHGHGRDYNAVSGPARLPLYGQRRRRRSREEGSPLFFSKPLGRTSTMVLLVLREPILLSPSSTKERRQESLAQISHTETDVGEHHPPSSKKTSPGEGDRAPPPTVG